MILLFIFILPRGKVQAFQDMNVMILGQEINLKSLYLVAYTE